MTTVFAATIAAVGFLAGLVAAMLASITPRDEHARELRLIGDALAEETLARALAEERADELELRLWIAEARTGGGAAQP